MQHVSKKAKLFEFMATQKRSSASQLNVADVRQQFFLFKSDRDISGSGLVICNENRFCSLIPLTRKLLTEPAGSATRTCLRPS